MQKSMSLDKDQEKIILEALKILHEWVAIKDINKAQKKLAEIKTLPTLLATPHYCSLLTIAHELVAACLNQLKAPEHIETAEKLYYEVTQTIPQLIFTKLDFAIQIDFYYTAGCTFASAQQLKTALPYFCAALNLLEQLPENKPYILKTTQEAIHAKLTQLEIEGWLQILCRYWQKCPPFSTASKNALATLKQQFKALRTLGDGLAYLAQENNSDYYAQCLQHLYHPFLPLIEQAKQELNSKLNFAKQQKQEALLQFSELVNEQLLPLAQQLSFHGQWKLAEEFCGLVIAHYNQDGEDIEAFNTQVIVALSNCAHKKIIQPFFPYRAFWQQQRAQLKIYRDKWQDTVDKIDLSEWQIYYQEQVSALTSTALKRLSEPLVMPKPTAWCLVGGGSFGRQESLFYSDIDVALLIKTDVKENATYFDTILALLTFQIELWAEPWQWKSRELPLTKVSLGLRLDSGDLKYLCQSLEDSLNYQKYHLVLRQTPDKLAQFVVQNLDLKAIRAAKQNEQYHVLAHGLLGITPIFSFQEGAALVDNYYACIEQQLQLTISPFDNKFAPIHLYQWVGWQLFQEAVQDLYKMGRSWDKWPVTDLKQRYLAPLQRVCLAMGLFLI